MDKKIKVSPLVNKKVIIGIIGLIVIMSSLALGGYINIDGKTTPENSIFKRIYGGNNTCTKDVSDLVLDVFELPEGYIVAEKTPRIESDVSKFGINIGWKEGYYVKYIKSLAENSIDTSRIDLHISRYPLSNIGKTMEHIDEYEGHILNELPNPQIGEKSLAARYAEDDLEARKYQIEFYKKDIYVRLIISGEATDYELLKDLAKKIESKI